MLFVICWVMKAELRGSGLESLTTWGRGALAVDALLPAVVVPRQCLLGGQAEVGPVSPTGDLELVHVLSVAGPV